MKIKYNQDKSKASHYSFAGIKLVNGINELPEELKETKSFKTRISQGIFELIEEVKVEPKPQAKTTRKAKKAPEEVKQNALDV